MLPDRSSSPAGQVSGVLPALPAAAQRAGGSYGDGLGGWGLLVAPLPLQLGGPRERGQFSGPERLGF